MTQLNININMEELTEAVLNSNITSMMKSMAVLVFNAYMELRNLEPAHFTQIEALRRRYEDSLESILQQGQDLGVFSLPDTKLATLALIAMLTGVTNWYREGGRLTRADVEAIYADMALKAVGAMG